MTDRFLLRHFLRRKAPASLSYGVCPPYSLGVRKARNLLKEHDQPALQTKMSAISITSVTAARISQSFNIATRLKIWDLARNERAVEREGGSGYETVGEFQPVRAAAALTSDKIILFVY